MDIKIYTAFHKPCFFPESELLVPVQAGRKLNGQILPEYPGDDTGDNISERNSDYCELSVHYWAWKNTSSDYVGFCHYRRYFAFGIRSDYPYVLADSTDKLKKCIGDDEAVKKTISQYDIISVCGEEMYETVKAHFLHYPGHGEENLNIILNILNEMHPEFNEAAEQYLNGTVHYFCNMYIMRFDLFRDYCEWLFPMLAEFDRIKGSAVRNDRADGFLAERLFGIYYTWIKNNKQYRYYEVPRVDMTSRSSIVYKLFPPSTKRRYYLKKLLGKL